MLAAAALAGQSHAALQLQSMTVGAGLVNLQSQGTHQFYEQFTLAAPVTGSSLVTDRTYAGIGTFGASAVVTNLGTSGVQVNFSIRVSSAPITGQTYQLSRATTDLVFSTSVGGRLFIVGSAVTSIAPYTFAHGSLGTELIGMPSGPVGVALELGPGQHRISLFASAFAQGGNATLEGRVTFTEVPAPGVAVLLSAAGLPPGRRRRS